MRTLLCIIALLAPATGRTAPANHTTGNQTSEKKTANLNKKTKKKRRRTWSTVRAIAPGSAEAVGSYANDCLAGAVALPERGPGFELMRLKRRRYFAHPRLQAWLQNFGARVQGARLERVRIGDAAQARGGRMASGHRSHQTGLDVDVYFDATPGTPSARDTLKSLVTNAEEMNRDVFSAARHTTLLRLAAESPEVTRIFVNWVIKRELCATVQGDRAWLHKIRPWYGHDAHFHVRLDCPPEDEDCQAQDPVPPGDGCGEEIWFSKAAVAERRKHPDKKPKARTRRPARCAEILKR